MSKPSFFSSIDAAGYAYADYKFNHLVPKSAIRMQDEGTLTAGGEDAFVLKHGRVVDMWPKYGVVLVQVSGENMIKCTYNVASSGLLVGLLEVNAPTPGDLVLIAKKKGTEMGTIICAYPSVSKSRINFTEKWLSNSAKDLLPGQKKYYDPKTYEMQDKIFHGQQMGVSLKDVAGGDKIMINENMTGIQISKYFVRMQAGMMNQMTMNFMDDFFDGFLANIRVHNQAFSIESMNDYNRLYIDLHWNHTLAPLIQGEETNDNSLTGDRDIDDDTPEGIPDPKIIFDEEFDEERREQYMARLFAGWLACGTHIYVQQDKYGIEPYADIHLGDMSMISSRTATALFCQKTNHFMLPKRIYRPDSDQPDANRFVDGRSRRPEYSLRSGRPHDMGFGCDSRDYVAWMTAGGFQYGRYDSYEQDFEWDDSARSPKPKPLQKVGKKDEYMGEWMEKEHDIEVKPTEEAKEWVESDLKQTSIPGEAFMGIMPDGSIMIRDAWGTQVELRCGKLVLSCANEVEITSGRNIVMLAGMDTIIKSGKNCEVFAMNGDIRMRSAYMTHIESARSGVQITVAEEKEDEKEKRMLRLDRDGEEYRAPSLILKADDVRVVGKKFEASVEDEFSLQGKDHENPPKTYIRAKNIVTWTDSGTFMKVGEEEDYSVVTKSGVLSTGYVMSEKIGFFDKGVGTNSFVVAIDGPIASNGSVVGKVVPVPPDPPLENIQELELAEKVEILYEEEMWREGLRRPYKEEDYEKILYKHRTSDQYKTMNAKWFEKWWQRIYKDDKDAEFESIEYDLDEDEVGENSYPGKEALDQDMYFKYEEVNVLEDGTCKFHQEMQQSPGEFTEHSYRDQLMRYEKKE